MTNSEMFGSLEFVSVAGPTSDQQPPFQWSKADFGQKTAHLGHPDMFLFKPIQHKWGTGLNSTTHKPLPVIIAMA